MPNVIVQWLVDLSGTPAWFVGGLAGLTIFIAIYVIMVRFGHMKGIMLASMGLFLAVINFVVFEWPIWAAVVAGIAVFYQATNKPAVMMVVK